MNLYGAMMAVAFLVGLWTASRRAAFGGVAPEKILDAGPWLIIGAIVGARVLYVITFWREQFAGEPITEIFKVWRGGLVYYGGLIGACAGCILFARVRRVPLWKAADIFAPSIALGQAFGRIGCFFNGCCYGRGTTLPWAVCFPEGHETHPRQHAATPVHPTQLYETILVLGLYFALAWWFRRKKFDGQVFGFYLVGYAMIRSIVELSRGDYPGNQLFLGGWATPAHLVSIVGLAAGVALLLWRSRVKPAAAS